MREFMDKRKENSNLLNILSNGKKNVIFGAGSVGSMFRNVLDDLNISVYSFLVNNGHRTKNMYLGIPIYELSDFPLNKFECNVFIAIRTIDESIINPIRLKMDNNIIYVDYVKDLAFLESVYYTNYFKENGIDISKDVLNINGFKMINPFIKKVDYMLASLFELGDIMLPEIMSDDSKIDEGNYEYGDVTLNENDIVFDCGANIGLFSAVSAFKKCRVYAFEPFPKTQNYLKEMIDLYPGQIYISKYALSNYIGYSNFNILSDYIGGNSMLDIELNSKDYVIKVETITIDKFIEENNIEKLDFIKADIEGAERYMLMGARKSIKEFKPKISICTYHLKDDPEVLEKIIKEIEPKYVIEHKWKKLYAHVPKE
ncbi:FkbM family methyltransferase [Clostridium sp. LBM24168]